MLESLLHQEIQEKGPLSQSRFMEMALQHPIYGYYRSQEGVTRDFTTSPEISQVFGELIGIWAIAIYQKLNEPKSVSVVELGPGKGTLMADFLRASKLSKSFLKSLNLCLVEINPVFQAAQKRVIQSPALWVEKMEDAPSSDPLILIANEFFDSLPVRYFVRKNNVLSERYVDLQKGKLVFSLKTLQENKGPDQNWEESPAIETLITEICARLLKQTGVFLCIDYGYENGYGESLQSLYKGTPSNPLSHVGKSDLTCHVNFGRIKEIALSQGLGVLGPIPQGHFLKNMGLDIRIEELKKENPSQRASLEAAAIRLTHPQQMGALFQVMAVFSPPTLRPIGFDI